jgi:hypothetical protein
MLDQYARDRLAAAIGHDASRYASRFDFERDRTCRHRGCVAVADPSDPMGYCGPCAERDGSGR